MEKTRKDMSALNEITEFLADQAEEVSNKLRRVESDDSKEVLSFLENAETKTNAIVSKYQHVLADYLAWIMQDARIFQPALTQQAAFTLKSLLTRIKITDEAKQLLLGILKKNIQFMTPELELEEMVKKQELAYKRRVRGEVAQTDLEAEIDALFQAIVEHKVWPELASSIMSFIAEQSQKVYLKKSKLLTDVLSHIVVKWCEHDTTMKLDVDEDEEDDIVEDEDQRMGAAEQNLEVPSDISKVIEFLRVDGNLFGVIETLFSSRSKPRHERLMYVLAQAFETLAPHDKDRVLALMSRANKRIHESLIHESLIHQILHHMDKQRSFDAGIRLVTSWLSEQSTPATVMKVVYDIDRILRKHVADTQSKLQSSIVHNRRLSLYGYIGYSLPVMCHTLFSELLWDNKKLISLDAYFSAALAETEEGLTAKPLQGVVAMVSTMDDEQAFTARPIAEKLLALGAKVLSTITNQVTHVVFEKSLHTVIQDAKRLNIPLVTPSWVSECEKQGRIVDADLFKADESISIDDDEYQETESMPFVDEHTKYIAPLISYFHLWNDVADSEELKEVEDDDQDITECRAVLEKHQERALKVAHKVFGEYPCLALLAIPQTGQPEIWKTIQEYAARAMMPESRQYYHVNIMLKGFHKPVFTIEQAQHALTYMLESTPGIPYDFLLKLCSVFPIQEEEVFQKMVALCKVFGNSQGSMKWRVYSKLLSVAGSQCKAIMNDLLHDMELSLDGIGASLSHFEFHPLVTFLSQCFSSYAQQMAEYLLSSGNKLISKLVHLAVATGDVYSESLILSTYLEFLNNASKSSWSLGSLPLEPFVQETITHITSNPKHEHCSAIVRYMPQHLFEQEKESMYKASLTKKADVVIGRNFRRRSTTTSAILAAMTLRDPDYIIPRISECYTPFILGSVDVGSFEERVCVVQATVYLTNHVLQSHTEILQKHFAEFLQIREQEKQISKLSSTACVKVPSLVPTSRKLKRSPDAEASARSFLGCLTKILVVFSNHCPQQVEAAILVARLKALFGSEHWKQIIIATFGSLSRDYLYIMNLCPLFITFPFPHLQDISIQFQE